LEDLVQAVVAIAFDWLRPHAGDGAVSRRRLWARWALAFLVAAAIVALAAWLAIEVGAPGF